MSIIVYPKLHFGESKSGKDKQFKFAKKLVKYGGEIVKILPSESETSDPIHGLDYGVKMKLSKALKRDFFQRYSSCGCGFEYDGDNQEFIALIKPVALQSTKKIETTKKEINEQKAIVGSQNPPQSEDEVEALIENNFFEIEENKGKSPIVRISSGLSFVSDGKSKAVLKATAVKALKEKNPKVNKKIKKITELYHVNSDTNNILLRKATESFFTKHGYIQRYLIFSASEGQIRRVEKFYSKKNKKQIDEPISSVVSYNNLQASDSLIELFEENYKDFDQKEVLKLWDEITN